MLQSHAIDPLINYMELIQLPHQSWVIVSKVVTTQQYPHRQHCFQEFQNIYHYITSTWKFLNYIIVDWNINKIMLEEENKQVVPWLVMVLHQSKALEIKQKEEKKTKILVNEIGFIVKKILEKICAKCNRKSLDLKWGMSFAALQLPAGLKWLHSQFLALFNFSSFREWHFYPQSLVLFLFFFLNTP